MRCADEVQVAGQIALADPEILHRPDKWPLLARLQQQRVYAVLPMMTTVSQPHARLVDKASCAAATFDIME